MDGPLPNNVALLVIFRHGVWDLPKDTQDPSQSIEMCARREVQEEVGIETLRFVRRLGTTQHGYPDGDCYADTWIGLRKRLARRWARSHRSPSRG